MIQMYYWNPLVLSPLFLSKLNYWKKPSSLKTELLDYDLRVWKYVWMSLSFDFLYFQPRLIVEIRPGLGTRLLTFESMPNLIKCCLFDFPWASNMSLTFSRKGIKSSTMAPLLMLLCHYHFWLSVTSLVKSKKFYTQDGMSTSSKPILKR